MDRLMIESDLDAEELMRRGDLALGFAGMMDGRTKQSRMLTARGRAMVRLSFEKRLGPIDPEIAAMSDDEIAEALG